MIKNGYLVAEKYFNGGSIDQKTLVASVSKSYVSTLVGLALDQGCLASLDQKFLEFFPEQASQVTDARKKQITIRQLLQMRSGYPWEETHPELFEAMWGRRQPAAHCGVPANGRSRHAVSVQQYDAGLAGGRRFAVMPHGSEDILGEVPVGPHWRRDGGVLAEQV